MERKFKRSLTPKQKAILDYITIYTTGRGYAPSLEEIGNKFDLAISTAHQHVKALERKSYLKKEGNQPRGVSLFEQTPDTVEIPLLGLIAAGNPIEPIENPEPIRVPKNLISSRGDYCALRVKGDSMIEDGICDQDVVVIKSQSVANNGESIVAVTEEGATLKVFKNKSGTIILEPRNKKLKNIYPKSLEIKGIFKGLIRNNN